jgi:hypothetical protein
MITLAVVSRFIPMKANYEKKGTKMTTQDKRKAGTKTRRKLKQTITIRDLSPSGNLVRGGTTVNGNTLTTSTSGIERGAN